MSFSKAFYFKMFRSEKLVLTKGEVHVRWKKANTVATWKLGLALVTTVALQVPAIQMNVGCV